MTEVVETFNKAAESWGRQFMETFESAFMGVDMAEQDDFGHAGWLKKEAAKSTELRVQENLLSKRTRKGETGEAANMVSDSLKENFKMGTDKLENALVLMVKPSMIGFIIDARYLIDNATHENIEGISFTKPPVFHVNSDGWDVRTVSDNSLRCVSEFLLASNLIMSKILADEAACIHAATLGIFLLFGLFLEGYTLRVTCDAYAPTAIRPPQKR